VRSTIENVCCIRPVLWVDLALHPTVQGPRWNEDPVHGSRATVGIAVMRFLCMAAERDPNVLFCMPNRTKCILFISVMEPRM
jgi:hypothetical protein